ncbi:carboxymuconolactone decarboxylase family protein, partial [Streptomyces sp. NPDC004561]
MTSLVPAGTTRRIFVDKQSPKAYHALVQTSEAVRAVAAEAGLDRTLVELVNLRVSQINGCAYCLHVHTRAALRAGDTPRRLGVLAAWRDTELFTPAERAALALAEATTAAADACSPPWPGTSPTRSPRWRPSTVTSRRCWPRPA